MKKLQNLRQFIIDNSKINTNVSNDLIDAVVREVQADVETYKTAADVTFTPVTETAVAIGSTVALASETADAQIYYTVDGSAPDNTDTLYTGPIVITDDVTIKAITYHNYQNPSASTTAVYTLLAAATPIADPVAGGVPDNSTVAISCATPNSTVYYTTNGDEPTDTSTKYIEPILITDAVTIKAIAYVADRDPSVVLTAAYTIAGAATPVASPVAGGVPDNSTITLTCATASSIIYYTVNGDTPTDASTEYTEPIAFTDPVTIKAIAYAENYEPSQILTAAYTHALAATPVATPEAGAIADNSTITLTCATADSTIYYTVNGDVPTDASTEYVAPIDFTDAVTIKAIAYAENYEPSEVLVAEYSIALAETPVPSVAAGAVADNSTVALTCATAGATIYYTTDGDVPTDGSTEYTVPIAITDDMTIKAIAKAANYGTSLVLTSAYTIAIVADPVASPVGGVVADNTPVTLSTPTTGATIYYTVNGDTPTNGSTLYTAPIVITDGVRIKAIAYKADHVTSGVLTAAYTISA